MARILLAADDHYGQHCADHLRPAFADHQVRFLENDLTPLGADDWVDGTDLLALHCIAGTCGNPMPGPDIEAQVRRWLKAGKPLLLLHGASAAFWHWDWWRPLVGHRWVRKNDPDGAPPSTHPVRPYRVTVQRGRHPLCERLVDLDLPADEIYIDLEQTCQTWQLMTTATDEGAYVQCHAHVTAHGGEVIGFLPGHAPAVTTDERVHRAIRTLAHHLLGLEP